MYKRNQREKEERKQQGYNTKHFISGLTIERFYSTESYKPVKVVSSETGTNDMQFIPQILHFFKPLWTLSQKTISFYSVFKGHSAYLSGNSLFSQ